MTEIKWGAPLTGEQMKLLRDAGLPDGTNYSIHNPLLAEGKFSTPTINEWTTFAEHELITYKLPINHTAYTLLEKGWLDIPNVRLWFGGDKAPEGWDGGDVLWSDGLPAGSGDHWDGKTRLGGGIKIIAYIAKVEASYPPDGGLKDQVRDPSECQSAFQTITDTVTISKMTVSDIDAWIAKSPLRIAHNDARNVFAELGLIKPEPTLEGRFREKFPAYVKSSYWLKGWVKLALEFERD